MSAQLRRIEVHHHILPPEYVSALAGLGITGGGGIPFPAWGIATTLEMMDRQGIAAALLSVSSPGVHFGHASFARDLARRCNEISARLVSDHPSRFGAFATLPLPDVKGALPELVTQASIDGLARFDRFDEAALQEIKCDNALALLPRLQERLCHFRPNPATSP